MTIDLHFKKKIDAVVGLPCLMFVNLLARLVALVIKRNHQITPVKTVLVMKFQGMGSIVIAKPALRKLRAAYPNAKIIFWGTPGTCVLARELPEFDQILTLNDSGPVALLRTLIGCLLTIWREKIDWCFDLEVYSKFSAVFATLTCARNRAGFVLNVVQHRKGAYTHLVFFNRYEYLGRAYNRLIGLVYNDRSKHDDVPDWGPWKFALSPVDAVGTSPYFVLNIHAGELSLERRWPREKFEQLAQILLKRFPDHRVVLIGKGKREETECAAFMKHPNIVDVSGKLSLPETVRVLANAKLVVSNDTAPLHLALSTPVPVVGLFGPTRAQSYFPESRPRSAFLTQNLYCSPCIHHWDPPPCGGDNQCMKTISVDQVTGACLPLLGTKYHPEPQTRAPSPTDYYEGLIYQRQ